MTCIIALRTPNDIFMASDSAVTSDNDKTITNNSKIIIGKDYLIGVAGRLSLINCMENFKFREKNFIPDLKKHLFKNDLFFPGKEIHEDKWFDGSILIAYKRKILNVSGDFSVMDIADCYHAIGSSTPYAMASMSIHCGYKYPPKEALALTMEICKRHDWACDGPFRYFSLKKGEIK